uniref:Amidophosphoribosyltransferase n=2 Tax=Candidatus Bipolaricaulota TaxID=67810 RepID=H5SJJ1_9BACT|nr:amidophosphoribosyltransferase [uncultured Acetothermia bacterium]BAL60131.1 amidophosphoribosyltransferase [Candidatus Acetothermum autotrophicum]
MRALGSALANAVLDLFYPPHCAVCEAPFSEDQRAFLCADCEGKIERIPQSHLCRCGIPLPETLDLCPTCANSEPMLEQIRSFGWYEEREDPTHVLSALIKIFKYGGERALVSLFASYLDQAGQALRPLVEKITFVPMLPKDERLRGFNQAELLARELGRCWELPVEHTLEKVKETKPQASLPHEARRENVRGAFRLAKFISCASILIVDDVCTTGATLTECASVLKNDGGIEKVYGLTVARAAQKNIRAEDV